MREEGSARLQHAEVFGNRLLLVFARQHREHRLVDDDVKALVGERQRHRVALDHVDHILHAVLRNVCTRLRKRRGIHIQPRNAAAVCLRERDHRRSHIAGDLEHACIRRKVYVSEQPLRRLASARTQAGLAEPREELMSHLRLLLFCHRNHSHLHH